MHVNAASSRLDRFEIVLLKEFRASPNIAPVGVSSG